MIANLPVIDLSDLSQYNSTKLAQAASKTGVVLLKNHFLTQKDIKALVLLAKQFFDLPPDIKETHKITKENYGYIGPFVENLDIHSATGVGDAKEAFNITNFNLCTFKPQQPLPSVFKDNLVFLSLCLRKYYVLLHTVCRMLAIGLNIKDSKGLPNHEYFVDAHALDLKSHSTLRFVHYPEPDKVDGSSVSSAGAHTDYGSMTFVLGTNQGLQIFDGNEWLDVEVPTQKDGSPFLVLNIADVLNFWTNGYLKSAIHRVRATQERYAIVFFCHPGDGVLLNPVNSKIVKEFKGNRFDIDNNGYTLTALEHLYLCLRRTYKDKNDS
ncbi:hypothetical protein CANINC_004931 [Pichia inconspicua]|uniref:Fe2OG dioxygenase domain-containing protein n=1 Tax=Pichia inconspicua TaxID=52247 RepID=A0A4T0WUW9_9ASCO|nr:hypothetical protein CANINC_004931 [[Candida] inconspicua]